MTNVAGIDWASEEHALCVVDETGTRLRERVVAHEETGIAALCRELVALEVQRSSGSASCATCRGKAATPTRFE
jgi:hypothetical protein